MKTLHGTGVALVTPFLKNGSTDIDWAGLENLIKHNIEGGVDYFVLHGTTGETATLTTTEKLNAIERVVGLVNGQKPIVYGLGGYDTKQVAEEMMKLEHLPFEAVLSVTPYYNKPSQEGLRRHYLALAEVSKHPIILYNVPSRTGVNLLPATAVAIAREAAGKVIGIKEASGSIEQAMAIIQAQVPNFYVTSGDDLLTLPLMTIGAVGCISVIAQALPSLFTSMVNAAAAGDFKQAAIPHYKLMQITQAIYEEGNPTGIKSLLAHQGIISSPATRLPLVEASQGYSERLKTLLDAIS